MTDFTKPVQTRNGLPVTIITTEGRGLFPIIGYMGDSNYIESWLSNGKGHKHKDSCYDLINVPEKRVGYINIFQHENSSGVYKSRGSADKCGLAPRIACIRVEYTDGQFDD